jgi:hypothetical protein
VGATSCIYRSKCRSINISTSVHILAHSCRRHPTSEEVCALLLLTAVLPTATWPTLAFVPVRPPLRAGAPVWVGSSTPSIATATPVPTLSLSPSTTPTTILCQTRSPVPPLSFNIEKFMLKPEVEIDDRMHNVRLWNRTIAALRLKGARPTGRRGDGPTGRT